MGLMSNFATGVSRLPYRVLGAPVDLASTLMGPLGYPVKKPIMGSEWLIDQAIKAKLAKQRTGSGAELAGDVVSGLLDPSPSTEMALASKVGGLLGDPQVLNNVGGGLLEAMTVFHGSPHNFDKFDMSKIGTGEGAQAYGHGLYVAENPNVAKDYSVKLSHGKSTSALLNKNPLPDSVWQEIGRVMDRLDISGDIQPNQTHSGFVREILDDYGSKMTPEEMALLNKHADPKGTLYTVDLPDSHIANMLDWDAPLSQQPEAVRNALKFEVVKDPEFAQGLSDSPWLLNLNGQTINGYKTRKEALGAIQDSTGAQLYATLAGGQGQPWASKKLAEFGIPGIKYLDGGSRAAGEGSRNYVVFDDKLLKILKKE